MSEIKIFPQANDTVIVQSPCNDEIVQNTVIIKNAAGREIFNITYSNDGKTFKFDAAGKAFGVSRNP